MSVSVADPGFPIGGANLEGGSQLPACLRFVKFKRQNKRIGTFEGGVPAERPLDPPMSLINLPILLWLLC